MRFQDELTQAFRSSPAVEPRRYVLRQIGDLPPSVDFDDVVALLRAAEAAGPLSALATTTLSRLLPRWLAARHGADARAETRAENSPLRDASRSGKTPVAHAPASWVAVLPPAGTRGLENETWVSAGSHLFEGCVDPLLAAARGGAPEPRAAALRTLARLLHPRARAYLRDAAAHDGAAAVALATTGDPEALPVVLAALRRDEGSRPELVRLLDRFPALEALREIRAALKSPAAELRVAAAIAVEGLAEHDPLPLARPLLETWQDRWPLVQLVDSLGRAAGPDAVPELIRLYQGSADVLVRVAAVRSIVNLGGPAAGPFCHDLLETGSHPVQAIVIGGLARLGYEAADLRDALLALSDGLHARLAVNAAIALAAVEPAESARRAVAWLRDGDPVVRQQGAFLLGYLPSPTALKVASRLAAADAAPAVRLELLRTLAKYPAAQAGEALDACLDQPDPAVRARAVRLRAQAGDLAPGALAGLVRARLATEADPEVRAELVLQLGLTGDASAPDALAAELAHADPRMAGAAALAIGATGHGPRGPLEALARSVDAPPGARARAVVALFALGDPAAGAACRGLLAGGPAEVVAGAQALEEVLLLLPRLPASARHLPLRQWLTGHLRTPAYEEFSRERLGIRPAAVRAFADVQDDARAPAGADTASAVGLLAELEQSGVRAAGASGRVTRPGAARAPERTAGWSGLQTALSLVLALACTGFLMVRELQRPRAAPAGVAGAAAPAVLAGVVRLDTGQVLELPATVTAGEDRVVLALGVRQNRLTLAPHGRVTLVRFEPAPRAGAYALSAKDLTGTLILNAAFGEPKHRLEIGDVIVEAGRAVLKIDDSDKHLSVKVAWNEATIVVGGRVVVVREAQGLTVRNGSGVGEPVPLEPAPIDMAREIWR